MDLDIKREEIKNKAFNESFAIISFKLDGTIKNANEKFLSLFGYKLEEIKNKHHKILCDEDFTNSIEYRKFWYELSTGKLNSGEFKRIKKDGTSIYLQATYKPLINDNGQVFEILKFAQDITKNRLETQKYEIQLKAINKAHAVIEFDMDGNILKANKNFLNAMGYKLEEIKGKHHKIFCDKEYSQSKEYKNFWEKLNKGKFDTGKYLREGKNGKKVWIQATYTPILDLDKNPVKIIKFAQDITQFEIVKKDTLTGLYNREKLLIDIEQNKKNNLAVIDINSFFYINDFFGNDLANNLIKKAAEELSKYLKKDCTLYKININRFTLLNNTFSKEKFQLLTKEINEQLKNTLIDLDIKRVRLNNTIGISFENKSKILSTAEIINKYAKDKNKSLLVYSESFNIEKEFEENLWWTEKIRDALEEDRVIVYYQAIFNNFSKKIEKYEALVRIIDSDETIISPFQFLDIAKKSRQYIEITKRVIQKSFENFKDKEFQFSINLTMEDILDDELQNYLFSKIEEYNIAKKLVVELVESEKITTYEPVFKFIDRLKALGCEIAIDDFGSGYSNFEYLVKIDADYVKIDGSIIKRILENTNSLEVVKSIVSFTKKMKIKTIAEFISNKELLEKVNELGIDYSQGFYIGKPQQDLQ
ncbi:EAL domain-containing protein [Campylobacterota bacterium DY0563]